MCYSLSCVFKQNCVQLEFDYCWKPVCVVCLAEFEKKKPKDLHILYPSAAAKAVRLIGHMPVSYTHLTLPTKRIV